MNAKQVLGLMKLGLEPEIPDNESYTIPLSEVSGFPVETELSDNGGLSRGTPTMQGVTAGETAPIRPTDASLFCLAISAGDPGVGFVLGKIHNIFDRALARQSLSQEGMKQTYLDFPFTVCRSLQGGEQEIDVLIRVTHYKSPGDNGALDHRDPAYEPGEVEFGNAFTAAGEKITLTDAELEAAEERFWNQ